MQFKESSCSYKMSKPMTLTPMHYTAAWSAGMAKKFQRMITKQNVFS